MVATGLLEKSPYMKEWMAQADPPKEDCAVKKMNGRLLLLLSNKMTHYFKEWTTASGVLKKIYYRSKNLMLQIDPLNSSCSQKLQYPKRKFRLIQKIQVLRKSSSLEKVPVLKVIFASANVYNCSSKKLLFLMNNCNCCCKIVKLKWDSCKCFRAFNTVLLKQKLLQLVL